MGELGALGVSGRSGRVEDHGGVIGVPVRRARRLAPRQQRVERARLDDDHLGVVRPGPGRLRERVPGEQDAGARVGHVVRDLALLEQHVHRHDRGACAQRAVVADREVHDVRQHHPDAVARLDVVLAQQPGDQPRCPLQRGVRQRDAVLADRRAVAVARRRRRHQVGQVHGFSLPVTVDRPPHSGDRQPTRTREARR